MFMDEVGKIVYDAIKAESLRHDLVMERINRSRPLIEAAIPAFEHAKTFDESASLYINPSDGLAQVSGVLLSILVEKASQVNEVLKKLNREELRLESIEDYAEIGRRKFSFKHRKHEGPRLHVMFFFYKATDNACKFVKVGEKLEPIYELHCPDGVVPNSIEEGGETNNGDQSQTP